MKKRAAGFMPVVRQLHFTNDFAIDVSDAMTPPQVESAFLREFLEAAPLNPLGPGRPNRVLVERLQKTAIEDIFSGQQVRNPATAQAVLAGLYLLADDLDQSHEISQSIHTPAGNFWHGIMHRREPDYGNAKYWFHRVGRHPVYADIAAAARETVEDVVDQTIASTPAMAYLKTQTDWDADHFVDLCQQAARTAPGGPLEQLCRIIQRRECELLLTYCCAEALGS